MRTGAKKIIDFRSEFDDLVAQRHFIIIIIINCHNPVDLGQCRRNKHNNPIIDRNIPRFARTGVHLTGHYITSTMDDHAELRNANAGTKKPKIRSSYIEVDDH